MIQNTSEAGSSRKRGRVIFFAVAVLLAALAVWKIIVYQSQPKPVMFTPTPDGVDALRYLAEAKSSANAAGADFDKIFISLIAAAQARAGDLTAALATANAMAEGVARSWAAIFISAAQAEKGDLAGAQATVKSFRVEADIFIYDAWGSVAAAQAKAGNMAAAKATADIIKDASSKGWALSKIAKVQAKTGDVAGAKATTDAITQDSPKVRALGEVAAAQARAGDKAGANQTLAQAELVANAMKGEVDKGNALREVAAAQAGAGNVAKARVIVGNMISLDKWRALRGIARGQAKTEDFVGAKATANDIEDKNYRALTLADVALALGRKGDRAGAIQTLVEARAARDLPRTSPDKGGTLCEIAAVQAKVGDITGAQATMNSVTEDDYKSIGFTAIAIAQAKAGDIAGAKTTLNAIESNSYSALVAIMAAQARAEGFPATERWVQKLAEPKARSLYYLALAEARLNPNAPESDDSDDKD